MKHKLFKTMVAASSIAMICACGDDSSSGATDETNNTTLSSAVVNPGSSASIDPGSSENAVPDSPCNKVQLLAPAWLLDVGTGYMVIHTDNSVTDASGNPLGTLSEGNIVDITGTPLVQGVDLTTLTICDANATIDPNTGEVVSQSSSSVGGNTDPTSSASVNPNDTTTTPTESSSSVNTNPELDASGFPTIESYGEPPAEYTKDISSTGRRGFNTRYWDACKPHCSWISNGQEGKTDTTTQESYVAGGTTARNCNIHDVEVPTFTLAAYIDGKTGLSPYWFGYTGTTSACGAAKEKGVFTCTDMAPIAVNEQLSYGYVAGTADGTCGKCYHLQYDGSFKDESENNKPKATHQALKGKHMIVMASNIGHDVAGADEKFPAGQFDLMVPGGGVGAFDALSVQVNGQNINWGAGFGGFLSECQQTLGYDNTLEKYQQCVKDMCDAAFGSAGLPNLLRGCHWFADWYMAADNPTYYIEEVECPQYLIDHYMTRLNPTKDNRYEWHDDWSTFKEGDVLDTLECLTDEYPQGCNTSKYN